MTAASELRTEDAHNTHDIVATDWTLGESLTTCRACHHVSTLKQQTVYDGIHAHFAQVAVECCVAILT